MFVKRDVHVNVQSCLEHDYFSRKIYEEKNQKKLIIYITVL